MQTNSFVMMAVGDYRFCLDTAAYQDLERSKSWRWPTIERIGAAPTAQYVGPGEETVCMRGTVYPHFRGGLGQIESMAAEADRGEPLSVVDGMGMVWGTFAITDIRSTSTIFFANGAPRKIDFDITLKRVGNAAAGYDTQWL